ncbi:MAG TPA: methyltransferase domain-containing protein [Acidobacteriota bacterium]|nr:methyltransferase domain-containing protein [Acidobacteriota bacterium]
MKIGEYAKMARLQNHHWWFVAKRRLATTMLARHASVRKPARSLEIGCGTGAMMPVLEHYGPVVGLDHFTPALKFLRHGMPVNGDAQRLPFADARFDLVGCFDLLYHRNVARVDRALAEVARVLRPGGHLLITDSACPALYGRHDASHHGARRFSRAGLLSELAAAGLSPVHASYFHMTVFPAVAAMRIGGRWLDSALGRETPEEGQSQLKEASSLANALLGALYRVEVPLAARFRLPFGVSVVALARRVDS